MATEHMRVKGPPEELFATFARFLREVEASSPKNVYESRLKNPAWNVSADVIHR